MSLAVIACVLLTLAQAPVPAVDEMTAAADGPHLWFVQPAAAPVHGFELCHHSTTFDGPYFRAQTTLPQRPQAMAAGGNRVWLVFGPSDDSADSRREVFTLQVQYNAAFGTFYMVPQGRLEPVAALPGRGRLASFIVGTGVPTALIVPSPRSASELLDADQQPRLLQLMNGQWIDLPLPPSIDRRRPMLLTAAGPGGATLALLQAGADSTVTIRRDLNSSNQWTESAVPLDLRRVLSAARVGGQVAVALADRAERSIEVAFVRSDQLLPLARLDRPAGAMTLLGLDGKPAILHAPTPRDVRLQFVDPVTGAVEPDQTLVDQPMSGQRMWQAGLIFMAVAAGVLMLFAIKPLLVPPAPLPRGVVLLPPVRRLVALLIDLLPGAIVTVAALRCSPIDLLKVPVVSFDLLGVGPYLVMIGVTIVVCTASELRWSTTFGKRLMGGEIRSMNLLPPSPGRVIVRNLLKAVVLLAPPLGLVVVLNPHMQGLEDVAGRTLVVVRGSRSMDKSIGSTGNDAQ